MSQLKSLPFEITHNRGIVGHRETLLSTGPDSSVGICDVLDVTVESNRIANIDSGNFPWLGYQLDNSRDG